MSQSRDAELVGFLSLIYWSLPSELASKLEGKLRYESVKQLVCSVQSSDDPIAIAVRKACAILQLELDEQSLRPRRSIFDDVQLKDKHKPPKRNYWSGQDSVSTTEPDQHLLQQWANQFIELYSYEMTIEQLIHLSEQTLINVGVKDTSLHFAAKSVAAITRCLIEAGGEPLQFALIGGDLSGIQKFIYSVSSKGGLRQLRARSFYLELFNEVIADRLLDELGLTRANLLSSAGGGFSLLAPYSQAVEDLVRRLNDKINLYLWENFGIRLWLGLIVEPLPVDALTDGAAMSQVWNQLYKKLGEQKRAKWSSLLGTVFAEDRTPGSKHCLSCHNSFEASTSEEFCPFCTSMIKLGAQLPYIKGLSWVDSADEADFNVFDVRIKLGLSENSRRVYLISTEASVTSIAAIHLAVGSHIVESDIDALMKKCIGAKRMGVLRMDVDHLGRIFQSGHEGRGFNLLGYCELSYRLNYFFKVVLPNLLESPVQSPFLSFAGAQGRELAVNVVYAGGDDLFILGVWHDVIEAAVAIQQGFADYTGHNPSLTKSGGIVIDDYRLPLVLLAEKAGRAEHKAKAEGRDRLTIADWVLTWESIYGDKKSLRSLCQLLLTGAKYKGTSVEAVLTRSQIHNLRRLVTPIKMQEQCAWAIPRIYYYVSKQQSNMPIWFGIREACLDLQYLNIMPLALEVLDLLTKGSV